MSKCPFLSNNTENITCFKECCFYKEPVIEKCPFKQLEPVRKFIFKGIDENYDAYNDEKSLLNMIYENKNII